MKVVHHQMALGQSVVVVSALGTTAFLNMFHETSLNIIQFQLKTTSQKPCCCKISLVYLDIYICYKKKY